MPPVFHQQEKNKQKQPRPSVRKNKTMIPPQNWTTFHPNEPSPLPPTRDSLIQRIRSKHCLRRGPEIPSLKRNDVSFNAENSKRLNRENHVFDISISRDGNNIEYHFFYGDHSQRSTRNQKKTNHLEHHVTPIQDEISKSLQTSQCSKPLDEISKPPQSSLASSKMKN